MTVRPSFRLAAAAVAGIALLALALRFQADAADFRGRAERLRHEARSLAPDLAARAANDAALAALRHDLAEKGRSASGPADRFARVLSSAPTVTERPAKRLDCGLDAVETDLDVASADPDALSLAFAGAVHEGHRLVRLAVEPAPGGRVRAFLTFRTYALPEESSSGSRL